ncbi:hypothetical protein RhiirB3_425399 [Rhizophagus irregularis]|nr:hypothetical protein RhiirB3_425399 [Rhizophagus irregularis]
MSNTLRSNSLSVNISNDLEFSFSYFQFNYYKKYYYEELDILKQDSGNINNSNELYKELVENHIEDFKNNY